MKRASCDASIKEYLVEYEWKEYIRMPLDLPTKYFSKTMDEKYENKEKKDANISMVETNRKRYCSSCGKEISVYDGDVLEYNGMDVLCDECQLKAIKNKIK